jgi:hypothetical protein
MTQRNTQLLRRARVDGAAGLVLAFASAAADLPVPPVGCGVTKRHLPIWEALMRSRGRLEWKDHDLLVAARICRATYDLEVMRKVLRRAKFLQVDAKGRAKPHPLVTVSSQLSAEIRSDSRMLGLTARRSLDFRAVREAEERARGTIAATKNSNGLLV